MEKKKKKLLTTGLAVALAALLLIGGGTFAYLQSTSDDVANNFKTNQVKVNLTETTGGDYNIIPGTTQDKDPKVTVNNTVAAYVFVEVKDTTQDLVTYEIADGWTKLDGYDNVYYREVTANEEAQEFYVLKDNKVTYSADIKNDNMLDEGGNLKKDVKLTFKAYAIQKEPFTDAAAAYSMENATVVGTEEAFAKALESGQSVILSEDIVVSRILTIPEGSISVLDLNGKTITTGENSSLGQDRPIVNKGTLTVIGNGTIDTSNTGGYGAIRNYGKLTIENGVFKGDGTGGGSAVDNQSGGVTIINGGTYYATAAVMNRTDATMTINDGDFEGVSNDNPKYSEGMWSYAIRNYGNMTINGGNVHGSMNGGVACDEGEITINDGYFSVEKPNATQSYYVLVTSSSGKIVVNGGTFEQKNGTNRLIGGFSGMPSWDATDDLVGNGYTINSGTFILNGDKVEVGSN